MARTHTVTNRVVQHFIDNIRDQVWTVGEKIPSENTLTQTLGVSRASVRAAIQQFIGIGMMKSVHGKGTYLVSDNLDEAGLVAKRISDESLHELNKLSEFRLILETQGCYLAAENATRDNIEKLRFFFRKMRESIGDPKTFVHYDMLFHVELSKASGNSFLEEAVTNLFKRKKDTLHNFNELFGYKDGIYYHTLILKAVESRDPSRARRMMRDHLQKALDDTMFEDIMDAANSEGSSLYDSQTVKKLFAGAPEHLDRPRARQDGMTEPFL